MKAIRITSTAILSLLLATAAPAYARQEQRGEKQDHPQQQQSKHEQAKPDPKHAQPSRPDQRQQHAQQQQRQSQHNQQQQAQQQRGNQQARRSQQQRVQQQNAWQQRRARNWQSEHRNWQQRGGYNGYRIPDARYRGYFGPNHGFRIYGRPFMVVGGYPRFQYEGYWFSLVDPWPEYWGNNWYDTDEVYVTYVDNGYYMYNRRYPDGAIAIRISL